MTPNHLFADYPRFDPFPTQIRPIFGSKYPNLDPFWGPYSGLWPVRPGAKQTARPAGCQRAVEAQTHIPPTAGGRGGDLGNEV